MKVYVKYELYNPLSAFEGWLTRICVNTYRDNLRKKSRSLIFDNFATQEIKDTVMENVAIEEKVDFSDTREAVQMLPDKLRMTIILFYFEDLDIKQTAQVLRIPLGTVKSRLNKAKKLLKEMIQDEVDL